MERAFGPKSSRPLQGFGRDADALKRAFLLFLLSVSLPFSRVPETSTMPGPTTKGYAWFLKARLSKNHGAEGGRLHGGIRRLAGKASVLRRHNRGEPGVHVASLADRATDGDYNNEWGA